MKWLLAIPVLALAACATPDEPTTRPVVIQSKPIERQPLNLPPVDPYTARPVEWIVVTPENADEVFRQMEAEGRSPAIFGLDEQGYENLAINTQESLRVIMQQQAQIDGYRAYYLRVNRQIEAHNNSLNQ